jgi:hypothetical protein
MTVQDILDDLANEVMPHRTVCTFYLRGQDRLELLERAYKAGWVGQLTYHPIDNPDALLYTFKRIFVDDRLGGEE